jgi:hypothetical protein
MRTTGEDCSRPTVLFARRREALIATSPNTSLSISIAASALELSKFLRRCPRAPSRIGAALSQGIAAGIVHPRNPEH